MTSSPGADDSTSDASDGAMVTTATAVRRKSRRKTNSERGKEFRAKRKDYEQSLLEMIRSLRDEVRDLRVLREIRGDAPLATRNGPDGSPARLIREYFALFERGRPTRLHVGGKRESPSSAMELITKQDAFLRGAMDETMKFGGVLGVAALVDQWERYTLYHSSFRISVVSVEVSGSEESPLVTVASNLTVKLSRETFRHIFPHVADDEALVGRLVGKEITYRGVNQFQFGADDQRVRVYDSDVDFVVAFLSAGVSLQDVATLMGQARIADQYLLGEEPTHTQRRKGSQDEGSVEIVEILSEEPDEEEVINPPTTKRACQTIEYLLN